MSYLQRIFIISVVFLHTLPAFAAGPYVTVGENAGLPSSQAGSAFVIDGNFALLDYDLDGDVDVAMTGDGSPTLYLFENLSLIHI